MKKVFLHAPQYFQFYIQDPEIGVISLEHRQYDDLEKSKFFVVDGGVVIRVLSEYSEISISIETHLKDPPVRLSKEWQFYVECALSTNSGEIVLAGCPDGPEFGRFGSVELPNGNYRIRIYYGGQDSMQPNGETNDFYWIDIWKSMDV